VPENPGKLNFAIIRGGHRIKVEARSFHALPDAIGTIQRGLKASVTKAPIVRGAIHGKYTNKAGRGENPTTGVLIPRKDSA
jgi:hypothetical protein